jgi:hypothetical protein
MKVLWISINGNFTFRREIVGDIEELEISILPGKLKKTRAKK